MRPVSRLTAFGVVACCVLCGCDVPASPPKTAEGKAAKFVAVAPGPELDAVTALETARVNYDYRLQVLVDYYFKVGNMDKHNWAVREKNNLAQARTFVWEGVPQVLAPTGESLADADEHVLVEYAVSARNNYIDAVEKLAAVYEHQQQAFKAGLVRNMQQRLDPVRTYMYFLEAEIPPAEMKPETVVPEADAMFKEALSLHRQGKGLLPGLTDYNKQRQALMKFLKLVHKHPRSTKIALAAYYIAEIYKEYFNENVRAVHWYERAWQWDPNVPEPARFQAATVYDIRLHNFTRAVECYRQALQHDPERWGNDATAQKRIEELTGQKK